MARNTLPALTPQDVRAIQTSEDSARDLAIAYHVCPETIRRIRRGEQRYAWDPNAPSRSTPARNVRHIAPLPIVRATPEDIAASSARLLETLDEPVEPAEPKRVEGGTSKPRTPYY